MPPPARGCLLKAGGGLRNTYKKYRQKKDGRETILFL